MFHSQLLRFICLLAFALCTVNALELSDLTSGLPLGLALDTPDSDSSSSSAAPSSSAASSSASPSASSTERSSSASRPSSTSIPASTTEAPFSSSVPPPSTISPSLSPSASLTPVSTAPLSTSSAVSTPSTLSTRVSSSPSASSEQPVTQTATPPSAIQQFTTIIITTSAGSTYAYTSTGTTAAPASTSTAEPITAESPTASSGMDAKTKTTVIGVVCGVGGAIVLAVGFLVFWKFWSRRKNADGESDGLMMGTHGEKGDGTHTAANPFQNTLESYHAPSKPVNASSNF